MAAGRNGFKAVHGGWEDFTGKEFDISARSGAAITVSMTATLLERSTTS